MKSKFTYILVIVLAMSSCTKNLDDFGPQTDHENVVVPKTERVIVVNEGNFMFGNGSVSVINSLTADVAKQVFKSKNGYPLGDVPQSLTIYDSLGFIVVNNSGKIEVVNQSDFSSVNTITGFTSPRYLEVVSQNPLTAWVTDLYANKIWIVNLETYQITGSITSTGWSENLHVWNDHVLVLNKKDSVINVFDVNSQLKVKTIGTGMRIVDFKKWSSTQVLVLANSGTYILDLNTLNLSSQVLFVPERNPSKLAVDTILNLAYFLQKDVFRVSKSVDKVISSNKGTNFYGICVNSISGELFVTNAKDYVQPGTVIKYNSTFSDSTIFEVGVNPQFLKLE